MDIKGGFFIKKERPGLCWQGRDALVYYMYFLPVHAVVAAQVQQGEQINQAVVVNIIVTVLIGLVLE